MEDRTKEAEEIQTFFEFYVDLIENNRDTAVYYFAENGVIDWFGQTVKGEKNIKSFMRTTINSVKHEFFDIKPVTKIGYRDSHVVQLPIKKSLKCEEIIKSINTVIGDSKTTPPNKLPPLIEPKHDQEKGQGDGFHINESQYHSPPKKIRIEGQGDFKPSTPIKYLSTSGYIEFHKKSSKKLQSETKWKRPCKLEIAYSPDPVEKYIIHLVIYEGNMKCRKNLLKDFESCQSTNDT